MAWTHEPSGATLISDYGFSDSMPAGSGVPVGSSGWYIVNDGVSGTRGSDVSAPWSYPYILRCRYAIGFMDGVGPINMYRPMSGWSEGYLGFYWRPSDPWQGHSSGVNKIFFWMTNDGLPMYLAMYGPPGGAYQLCMEPKWIDQWFYPNVGSGIVTLGAWHQIEVYHKWHTGGGGNGILKWWLNGNPVGSYTDFTFGDEFVEIQIAPTWGGNTGEQKTETDWFDFDHIRVSSGSGAQPTPPTGTLAVTVQ